MKARSCCSRWQVYVCACVCFTLLFAFSRAGAANPPLPSFGNPALSDTNCAAGTFSLGEAHEELEEGSSVKVEIKKLAQLIDLVWAKEEGSNTSGNTNTPTGILIYRPLLVAEYLKIVDKMYCGGCKLERSDQTAEYHTAP